MSKPSLGRIVHYCWYGPQYTERAAAIVTSVLPNGNVDLKVFFAVQRDDLLGDERHDVPMSPNRTRFNTWWEWPPKQEE